MDITLEEFQNKIKFDFRNKEYRFHVIDEDDYKGNEVDYENMTMGKEQQAIYDLFSFSVGMWPIEFYLKKSIRKRKVLRSDMYGNHIFVVLKKEKERQEDAAI